MLGSGGKVLDTPAAVRDAAEWYTWSHRITGTDKYWVLQGWHFDGMHKTKDYQREGPRVTNGVGDPGSPPASAFP